MTIQARAISGREGVREPLKLDVPGLRVTSSLLPPHVTAKCAALHRRHPVQLPCHTDVCQNVYTRKPLESTTGPSSSSPLASPSAATESSL